MLTKGTDTVKRGISPANIGTTSLSNGRFKESSSSYSIKLDNGTKDARDCNTIERSKFSNNFGSRSVLFAPDFGSSSSSYSLSEHMKTNTNGSPLSSRSGPLTNRTANQPSLIEEPSNNTSTSQLIKQTLSPLAQHRNISQSNLDTNFTTKNQTNNSSLGTYQFPSSSLNIKNVSSTLNENHSPLRKSSSPSRSISNTNTLPSSVARNMLYQSDSSYSLKNQQTNFTSPGNGGPQTNNIYGTLPKNSTSPFGTTASSLYGNVASATGNEFDKLIARHQNMSSGTTTNNSTGNYNTLGSYRVQYSSTNPFLPSFNPNQGDTSLVNNKFREE